MSRGGALFGSEHAGPSTGAIVHAAVEYGRTHGGVAVAIGCDSGFKYSSFFADVLTESLLPDPLSYQLPRKHKIAFSGCSRDCAGATVNDLGFIAKTRKGLLSFAVYVGGGMGADSRVGQLCSRSCCRPSSLRERPHGECSARTT